MDGSSTTLEGIETEAPSGFAVWARRGFLTLLVLFVLAGVSGLLGVHSTTQTQTQSGWTLTLTHAAIARAGLDVPWQVQVSHPGGFRHPVTLAVTGDYFGIFETQGFTPEPAESARNAHTLYLTFTPPPSGDSLVVSYDAYIQPSSQRGRGGTVSVVHHGTRLATLHFTTRLLP